jgi:sulfur carrier protein ThiS
LHFDSRRKEKPGKTMTVAQLIEALQQMPGEAVVLLEGDVGLARVAGVNLEKSAAAGLPDEVILSTDCEE